MDRLTDEYGRNLNYVRISVTDRCNYRCRYCMPPEGVEFLDHEDIMRYEEIIFLCEALRELGVRKLRFTGGEPLVRRGMVDFLGEMSERFPEIKIALTTNGSLLSQYAERLAETNLHSLNISLDTLDPVKFADVTRLGKIEDVIEGIRAAVRARIRNIKLNTVLIKGFNDHEIEDLLRFAKREKLLLRLIEFMPLEDDVWNKDVFISGEEILAMLPGGDAWKPDKPGSPEAGPAKYYTNSETGDSIGIITAVSNHFCRYCNRLRISATGRLRTCLFASDDIPLRHLILKSDKDGLKNLIMESVRSKPGCWMDVRTGHLHMSGIGGYPMADYTHFDGEGRPVLVDVGKKQITSRTAMAEGWIDLPDTIFKKISTGDLKKGNPFLISELAGIMGAKKTPEIIPLCHTISLTNVTVRCHLDGTAKSVRITCEATASGVTGVEMEALTGVSVAALCFYDMCKGIDKGMVIRAIRLLKKTGGKSGEWKMEGVYEA